MTEPLRTGPGPAERPVTRASRTCGLSTGPGPGPKERTFERLRARVEREGPTDDSASVRRPLDLAQAGLGEARATVARLPVRHRRGERLRAGIGCAAAGGIPVASHPLAWP
jgi:hypothetical protein